MSTLYTDEEYEGIIAPVTRISARADILDPSGVVYAADIPVTEGRVSVDASSTTSRRTATMTLFAEPTDYALKVEPNALWYDKIMVPYRGNSYRDANGKEVMAFHPLGHFLIDSIDTQGSSGSLIKINTRDKVKALDSGKFGTATVFDGSSAPINIVNLIRNLASLSGLPITVVAESGGTPNILTLSTTQTFSFAPEDSRWKAIKDISTAHGIEAFFGTDGVLRLRAFRDPATDDPVVTYETGDRGNVADYTKSVGDSRLYNEVVVVGSGVDPPVIGWARVTNSSNPVNINRLGKRTYRYESAFIYTQFQADSVAQNILTRVALEEYELRIDALALPLLEAGDVVAFIDQYDTSTTEERDKRFFLSSFSIPLGTGTSNVTAKRVLPVN